MPEIVISEFMDEAVVARAFAGRNVLYDPSLVEDSARLYGALAQARALIVRNRTQVRAALLAAAPQLEAVGRLGVGLDNIDLEACRMRGISVHPATGANDVSVAEYVIGAMLVLLRGAWFATPAVIQGQWPRMRCIGRESAGRRLGLIGFGAIARETARRAAALGMRVSATDPFVPADDAAWHGVERLELEALLRASDGVSLHVPLTRDTRLMLDARRLSLLPRGAILINAARGGIVDEQSLAAALREGRIAGAALDVFETEPLGAGAAAVFDGVPNLLLTPHIAGVTEESNIRVSEVTAAAVLRALDADT